MKDLPSSQLGFLFLDISKASHLDGFKQSCQQIAHKKNTSYLSPPVTEHNHFVRKSTVELMPGWHSHFLRIHAAQCEEPNGIKTLKVVVGGVRTLHYI